MKHLTTEIKHYSTSVELLQMEYAVRRRTDLWNAGVDGLFERLKVCLAVSTRSACASSRKAAVTAATSVVEGRQKAGTFLCPYALSPLTE